MLDLADPGDDEEVLADLASNRARSGYFEVGRG